MEIYEYIRPLIDRQKYYDLYDEILREYERVPYHSRWHGMDVMRAGYEYYRKSRFAGKLEGDDLLTFLFGLLGHDAGHPGLGNQSEIARLRAFFPSSRSPLEEYHYGITLRILRKYGIVVNQELLHAVIMATDPRLSLEDARREFPVELVGMEVIVKLADVNHTVGSFEKHLDWSLKVTEEIGLEKIQPAEQIRFLENHVAPLVGAIKGVLVGHGEEVMRGGEEGGRGGEDGEAETGSELYTTICRNYTENLLYWKHRDILLKLAESLQDDD